MRHDFTPEWIEHFWARVDTTPGQGPQGDCHEWQGSRKRYGYGQLGTGPGRPLISAHRAAFLIAYGEIPDDKPNVLHSCDNPPCCNPDHLWAGTIKDNSQDMERKGRHGRGYVVPSRRKLSDSDVECIRALWHANTLTNDEIAAQFGVTASTVHKLVRFHRRRPDGISQAEYEAVQRPRWRSLQGSDNPHSKLTEDQVREIRRLYATGTTTYRKLGSIFGVTHRMIRLIVTGEKWQHVQ